MTLSPPKGILHWHSAIWDIHPQQLPFWSVTNKTAHLCIQSFNLLLLAVGWMVTLTHVMHNVSNCCMLTLGKVLQSAYIRNLTCISLEIILKLCIRNVTCINLEIILKQKIAKHYTATSRLMWTVLPNLENHKHAHTRAHAFTHSRTHTHIHTHTQTHTRCVCVTSFKC